MSERSHHGADALHDSASDDGLIAMVRAGNTGAYSVLYHRHQGSALAYARRMGGRHDPQDVAQEAFLKILKSIVGGGGPRDGFIGYLMRAVRNETIDRSRSSKEYAVDDLEAVDPAAMTVPDGVDSLLDRDLMSRAFSALPANWQEVLWLTEVEGMAPRTLTAQFDMSANAVAQLSRRAREGLRSAWLQAHVDVSGADEQCRQVAGSLGAYERSQLSSSRAARMEAHLAECERCSASLAELQQLSTRMRGMLIPVVLGSPLFLGTLSEAIALPGLVLPVDGGPFDGGSFDGGQGLTDVGSSWTSHIGSTTERLARWKAVAATPGWAAAVAGAAGVAVVVAAVVVTQGPGDAPSAVSAEQRVVDTGTQPPAMPEEQQEAGDADRAVVPFTAQDPGQLPAPPEEALPASDVPTVAPVDEGESSAAAEPENTEPQSVPAQSEPADPAPTPDPTEPAPLAPELGAEPELDRADPEPVKSEQPEDPAPEPEEAVPPMVVEPEPVEPEPEPELQVEPVDPDPDPPVNPDLPVFSPLFESPPGGTYALPVTLTGAGEPGALVRVHDQDGEEVGSTDVADDGTWKITPRVRAADAPTTYRAVQDVKGETSEASEPSAEYIFAAPTILSPTDGEVISWPLWNLGNHDEAQVVARYELGEKQEYAVIVDGQRSDYRARQDGARVWHWMSLKKGEHTLEIAYRDPVTGQLGAVRKVAFTVV